MEKMSIEEFSEKFCKKCGSQRCYGDPNDEFTLGCRDYNEHVLGNVKPDIASEMVKYRAKLTARIKKCYEKFDEFYENNEIPPYNAAFDYYYDGYMKGMEEVTPRQIRVIISLLADCPIDKNDVDAQLEYVKEKIKKNPKIFS